MSEINADHMREAIQLAFAAREKGNGPFGAVLVKGGEIILRAENSVNSSGDITAHAETNLVRAAWTEYDRDFLEGCTLYTSTEPCAMCAGAIYWSGIGEIVFGCSGETLAKFTDGSINISCREVLANAGHDVSIVGPVIEDEAMKPHEGFWEEHKGAAL